MLTSLIILLLSISPIFAESNASIQRDNESIKIKETYKIQGHVEYDDNPVETIYLDDDVEKPQINIPKRTLTIPVGVLNITSNANSPRSALAKARTNRASVSDIVPLSGSIAEKVGGFSYGQTWNQELSYALMEDTTSFFVRYDTPKLFSLTSSVRQSTSQDIGRQYNILRVVPEWHLTDRLTLKDSFSSYMNLPKNKNELTVVYTPALKKYADALRFELGVAQSFYRDGSQSSAVSFSTGFKL